MKIRKRTAVAALFLALSAGTMRLQAEQYSYDALNRVTTVTYDDGSYVTYRYDASGNIEEIRRYNKDGTEAEEPADPSTPDNPTDPSKPDTPDNPTDPSNPDNPSTPDTPDSPSGTGNTQSGADNQSETIRVETKTAIYSVERTKAGEGTAVFVMPKNKKKKSFRVPDKIVVEGTEYPVTEIADKAFYKCTKLKKITIGKRIERIGKKAFYGDKSLKKITVKTDKLSFVGKSALKGIHEKAVIKVPKKQLKKYRKLFGGKGQKKTVKVKK